MVLSSLKKKTLVFMKLRMRFLSFVPNIVVVSDNS